MNVTRDDILNANRYGLKQVYTSFWTPVLEVAYLLGYEGVDLTDAPVVTGYRYGSAPEMFVSNNYRDNVSEKGLSLAAINGQNEVGSSVWFSDRKKHEYTGVLSGTGSDGEPVILCFDAENLDN